MAKQPVTMASAVVRCRSATGRRPTIRLRPAAGVALAAVLSAAAPAQSVASASSGAQTQQPPSRSAVLDRDLLLASWRRAVPAGSGPYGTVRDVSATLPTHTIFRPARLDAVRGRLPIVAWAGGGCRNTPLFFTAFLAEIASRGYLVVAVGTNDETGKPPRAPKRASLIGGVDWAIRQDRERGSPLAGRVATDRIAYMGSACGAMQALSASVDPRTTTTVALNGGRAVDGDPAASPEWFEWSDLHAPVALFAGGPRDSPTAHESYPQIASLPVFLADLPVAHTGAYARPEPRWVGAIVGWLDWQLKGDARAGAKFRGPRCGLCTNPDWTVTGSKNLR